MLVGPDGKEVQLVAVEVREQTVTVRASTIVASQGPRSGSVVTLLEQTLTCPFDGTDRLGVLLALQPVLTDRYEHEVTDRGCAYTLRENCVHRGPDQIAVRLGYDDLGCGEVKIATHGPIEPLNFSYPACGELALCIILTVLRRLGVDWYEEVALDHGVGADFRRRAAVRIVAA